MPFFDKKISCFVSESDICKIAMSGKNIICEAAAVLNINIKIISAKKKK